MSKKVYVDRFYDFFINPPKKIAIISYEYKDEFGLHNMTIKVPCELVEFQAMYEENILSEYIFISSDIVDIGIKIPFPAIVRINRSKSKEGEE